MPTLAGHWHWKIRSDCLAPQATLARAADGHRRVQLRWAIYRRLNKYLSNADQPHASAVSIMSDQLFALDCTGFSGPRLLTSNSWHLRTDVGV